MEGPSVRHLDADDDLEGVVRSAGIPVGVPVVVVIGGASGMTEAQPAIRQLFTDLTATLDELGGAAVDGGTDAGVMRMLGAARTAASATFPLVGVAARGTVVLPGDELAAGDRAPLDAGHTHAILVPGDEWGAESPWLARVASVIAGDQPSVTLLVNGGEIAYEDVERSIDEGRRVIVLAGSGRTADDLGAAVTGDAGSSPRATAIAASGRVESLAADEWHLLPERLTAVLGSGTGE